MKRFMYAFVLLLCGYTSGRATKVINKFEASPTLDYAISEAKHWGTALEQADTHPSGELTFILKLHLRRAALSLMLVTRNDKLH